MTPSPLLLALAGAVLVLVMVIGTVITRYKIAGPNEAFIITGRKGKRATDATGVTSHDNSGQKVVLGAGHFVIPFVQQLFTMDLSARRIPVQVVGAVSKAGIKVSLQGVAIVKVGGSEEMIRAAAQRYLTQQGEIEPQTKEVLEGALRAIVGGLTVEEIIRDRQAFASAVAEYSESALTAQGLELGTFQIQDVAAEGTYLADLGRPEAVRAEQEAAIAEANARQKSEQARLAAEEQIAISQRDLALKQAQIKAETDAAQAQAAAAGPLAQAARDQEILAEQEKVAERQAALTERELDTQVRKPADAERYRVEVEAEAARTAQIKRAEADKAAQIAAAEAKARQVELSAQAEAKQVELSGQAERTRREALAAATKAEGDAQAAATLAVGSAEAEAMDKKAEAFGKYNEAAVLEMVVGILPQVVAKAAEPMSNIDNLTVVSTDGAGALTKTVTSNVAQGTAMLSALGIDLGSLLSKGVGSSIPAVTAARPATTGPVSRPAGPAEDAGQDLLGS